MKITKKYACGIAIIVFFVAFAIFSLAGMPAIVDKIVLKSVWLDPDKVDSWGQNPGRSQTVTMRNYTFFNMTNPHRFLYQK